MDQIKMAEVLVTGGAGFIGSHVAKRLLVEGHNVTVIDNFSEGKRENLPEHERLRVLDEDIRDFIFDRPYDTVFHLAAIPRVQQSIQEPDVTHDVNVNGTFNLLMEAKTNCTKRFVFSSSSSVYGDQKCLPFEETMTPNPMSPYALHKLMGEQYCELFNKIYGLSTICLRYFNVYGPRMNPDGAYANLLPKFIKLMKAGERPVVNGDGEQTRDFTNVADVVEANILAARSNYVGVLNIGSGKNISVNRVVEILNQKLETQTEPIHGPAVIEPKSTLADRSKAGRVLRWDPMVSFEKGILQMI